MGACTERELARPAEGLLKMPRHERQALVPGYESADSLQSHPRVHRPTRAARAGTRPARRTAPWTARPWTVPWTAPWETAVGPAAG